MNDQQKKILIGVVVLAAAAGVITWIAWPKGGLYCAWGDKKPEAASELKKVSSGKAMAAFDGYLSKVADKEKKTSNFIQTELQSVEEADYKDEDGKPKTRSVTVKSSCITMKMDITGTQNKMDTSITDFKIDKLTVTSPNSDVNTCYVPKIAGGFNSKQYCSVNTMKTFPCCAEDKSPCPDGKEFSLTLNKFKFEIDRPDNPTHKDDFEKDEYKACIA